MIDDCISISYKYEIQICKFRMTTWISSKDLDKLVILESYHYLYNFKDLEKYIKRNIKFTGKIGKNSFEKIY